MFYRESKHNAIQQSISACRTFTYPLSCYQWQQLSGHKHHNTTVAWEKQYVVCDSYKHCMPLVFLCLAINTKCMQVCQNPMSEVFKATELNKVFSGRQPCEVIHKHNFSSPWWWRYSCCPKHWSLRIIWRSCLRKLYSESCIQTWTRFSWHSYETHHKPKPVLNKNSYVPYTQSPLESLLLCTQSHMLNINAVKYGEVTVHTPASQSTKMLSLQMYYTVLLDHVEFQNSFCMTLVGCMSLYK